MELCVLGSGSSGNCSVLRTPAGAVLIDAGLDPRTVARRLDGTGVSLADITAICVTHLDCDHCSNSWAPLLIERNIDMYCHHARVPDCLAAWAEHDEIDEAAALLLRRRIRPYLDAEPFQILPGVSVTPVPLPHDQDGSHGFVIQGFGCRIGYATDLGHVPDHFHDCFEDLDILAIESNYDPQMQRDSARPHFLKQRVMGGVGHLSNEQAFQAVRAILDRAQRRAVRLPSHIVLLHRSRQCNCPKLVRKFFTADPRIASRLTLAEPYTRSNWLRPAKALPLAGEQLNFAFA